MALINYINVLLMIVVFMSGCAHGNKQPHDAMPSACPKEQDSITPAMFQGNPDLHYWHEPIVQEVTVPAHIDQGVFIPEHREYVLIKPGEWMRAHAQPVLTTKDVYEKEDVDAGLEGRDLTVLPHSLGQGG